MHIDTHTRSLKRLTCQRVYSEVDQDRIMMMVPPGHSRYFMANGRPSTAAPTIAVTLWKALYHLHQVKGSSFSLFLSVVAGGTKAQPMPKTPEKNSDCWTNVETKHKQKFHAVDNILSLIQCDEHLWYGSAEPALEWALDTTSSASHG